MSAERVIDVRGLNKRFGDKHVVKDFGLQVHAGEIYGFLGPNGSGKTTSIRMLCGLLTPDSGSGTCLGYDVIRETAAIKREVGYMTQRFSLWGTSPSARTWISSRACTGCATANRQCATRSSGSG
jgi:ABC-2 type transport system ATP-binding protein